MRPRSWQSGQRFKSSKGVKFSNLNLADPVPIQGSDMKPDSVRSSNYKLSFNTNLGAVALKLTKSELFEVLTLF